MRRALSVSVLLLSVTLQQACQRDEATAPQAPQPSAQAADASSSTSATTSRIAWDCFLAVCMMNADGSAQMFLTTQRDGEPSWSPDGRQIAFASSRDGNREIYVMTGRSQTRLTNDPADDSHPRWSPDGTRIAFMSRRDGNDEIYVMNADGSALTRLTNNPAVDINPSWSPDGQRIAFTSTRDGDFNEEIYVMAADGSGTTRLTNSPGLDDHPSWSPDGTQIAFMSRRDGNVEIYVMAPDGSNPTRLTNNPAVDFQPTWSPDGQHIAFASNRDGGNWEIYVMAADGSGQTRLTNSARQDWWPSWAPADPPPELILPGDLTVPATRLNGTIVNYTVTVTDPTDPALVAGCFPASGTRFSIGVSLVQCEVSDAAWNRVSGAFNITVQNAVEQLIDIARDLRAIVTANPGTPLAEKAAQALAGVEGAKEKLAETPPDRQGAEGELQGATGDLKGAVQGGLLSPDQGNALLDRIAGAARLVAEAAVATAAGRGATESEIAQAQQALADGDAKRAAGQFQDAVKDYHEATKIISPRFATVSAGGGHSCGVTTTGVASCWGSNAVGQVGNGIDRDGHPGGDPPLLSPVRVVGGLTFTSISLGGSTSCGVTTSGAGYCWGIGLPFTGENYRVSPAPVAGGLTFTTISAGPQHACGVSTSGTAYCWGSNAWGQLGDSTFAGFGKFAPVAVAGGLTFRTISTGRNHTCGVTTSGAAYCWGRNTSGQVGDGTSTSFWLFPVPVAGGFSFTTITTGSDHSCGLTADGTAYCWGSNTSGQLGDGSGAQQGTPVPVASGLRFTTIHAGGGGAHTCGLTSTGAVYCWGANNTGQLGDGTTTQRATPVAVAGGLSFTTVRGGSDHSCGVTTSREAYCWGGNGTGQLGNGTTTSSLTPVPVDQ